MIIGSLVQVLAPLLALTSSINAAPHRNFHYNPVPKGEDPKCEIYNRRIEINKMIKLNALFNGMSSFSNGDAEGYVAGYAGNTFSIQKSTNIPNVRNLFVLEIIDSTTGLAGKQVGYVIGKEYNHCTVTGLTPVNEQSPGWKVNVYAMGLSKNYW